MALALATLIGWLLLVSVVVVRGRLRHDADWTAWDVLRGVRALAVERLSESLALRLAMVGAGHEWGRRARAAGHTNATQRLSQAAVKTTRVLLRQLDQELAGYEQHAHVLQAATEVEPLHAPAFKHGALQVLARGERAVAAWLGPLTRLRLRLWTLRRGLELLKRRCDNGARADAADPLAIVADVQADLELLAQATVAGYRALLVSLAASRRRLGLGDEPLPNPDSDRSRVARDAQPRGGRGSKGDGSGRGMM